MKPANRITPAMPPARKARRIAIVLLLSAGILALAEVLLRVRGYGDNLDLFIEYPHDNRYLIFNPKASRRYFTNATLATTGNAELLRKEKDPNTLRLFVLGESTAIGYPYFHNGSFHRWLQYRLMNTFPGRKFEIINLSLPAVNTYAVLGFAKELAGYKPDAVLIYAGHNEYYGAPGVASTGRIGSNLTWINLVLRLRSIRLVQGVTSLVGALQDPPTRAANESIPYGSEQYNLGIAQFRDNLNAALCTLNEHNVPVFVSTLVSNIRDVKPFHSQMPDSATHRTFHTNYTNALHALEAHDSAAATVLFLKANADYNDNAMCHYYLGHLALHAGNGTSAREHLLKARDLDLLRFRAPSELNDIIRETCRQYPYTHCVDTEALFANHSANGITGNNLMLEHVHPNLAGYALLSDAFYDALKAQKIFTLVYEKEMTFSQLLAGMPITAIDSLAGLYPITKHGSGHRFTEVPQTDTIPPDSYESKLAQRMAERQLDWSPAMDSAYQHYMAHHALTRAGKVAEAMVLEHPTEQVYYERTAALNDRLGNSSKATTYFEQAFDIDPTFEKARYLFVLYLQQDKPFEALPYINYGMKHNTSAFNLEQLKAQVEEVVGMKEALKTDSLNVTVINRIAHTYFKMDNMDGAHKYVDKVLRIDAGNKEARRLATYITNKQARM
jgi:tetratricopeptide (TPR) repeat protein